MDPLGDVIDWLEHADLGEALVDGEEAATSSSWTPGGQGARELSVNAKSRGARLDQFSPETPKGAAEAAAELHKQAAEGSPAGSRSEGTPVFTGRQPLAGQQRASLTAYCGVADEPPVRQGPPLEPEEEEWDARQQQTGAAGRLVIYEDGDRPRSEFLLRGGCGRRIMVTAVTEGGKAAQAGVKAGDVLVSIDGKKDFSDSSADTVHSGLKGPVMLVFMGFVGKLQAEVRLNYKQKVCGLSSQHQVIFGRQESPVQVVDEVIFQPATATLFLATIPPGTRRLNARRSGRGIENNGIAGDDGEVCEEDVGDEGGELHGGTKHGTLGGADELAAVYELRNHEARNLVSRALSRAKTSTPYVPRYSAASNAGTPTGDHARVPRSITPSIAPFSSRLDGQLEKPPELNAKAYDFAAGGGGRPMGNALDGQDRGKPLCDAETWLGSTDCPRR